MKKSKKLKKHKKRSTYANTRKFTETEQLENGVCVMTNVISKRDKVLDNDMQMILHSSELSVECNEQWGRGALVTINATQPKCNGYCPVNFLLEDVGRFLPETLPKVKKVINNYNPTTEYVEIFLDRKLMIIMTVEKRFYSELTKL